MKSICVFCGSASGNHPEYLNIAKELGNYFSQQNIQLIYGGGSIGIMGAIARAVMDSGGQVTGVIPKKLAEKNVGLTEITRLEVVDTMHDRKFRMAELADAFIALPGGIGTLEELFESLTWLQLGYHSKPCGLLNTEGYYDLLIEFLHSSVKAGFLRKEHLEMLQIADTPSALINKLEHFSDPHIEKWLDEL